MDIQPGLHIKYGEVQQLAFFNHGLAGVDHTLERLCQGGEAGGRHHHRHDGGGKVCLLTPELTHA